MKEGSPESQEPLKDLIALIPKVAKKRERGHSLLHSVVEILREENLDQGSSRSYFTVGYHLLINEMALTEKAIAMGQDQFSLLLEENPEVKKTLLRRTGHDYLLIEDGLESLLYTQEKTRALQEDPRGFALARHISNVYHVPEEFLLMQEGILVAAQDYENLYTLCAQTGLEPPLAEPHSSP